MWIDVTSSSSFKQIPNVRDASSTLWRLGTIVRRINAAITRQQRCEGNRAFRYRRRWSIPLSVSKHERFCSAGSLTRETRGARADASECEWTRNKESQESGGRDGSRAARASEKRDVDAYDGRTVCHCQGPAGCTASEAVTVATVAQAIRLADEARRSSLPRWWPVGVAPSGRIVGGGTRRGTWPASQPSPLCHSAPTSSSRPSRG